MKKFYYLLSLILFVSCSSKRDAVKNETTQSIMMKHKLTGEGKTIVLVPGGLTGWVSWDSFIPHFASQRKVVQVQLLNVEYGLENKLLPIDYSVRMESDALANTLLSVNIDGPADFIGWSYGGLILLDYALNNPEKVRTLTLIEPPALWLLKNKEVISKDARQMMDYLASGPGKQSDVTEDDLEQFAVFAGFIKPGESAKDHPQWNNWKKFRQSLKSNHAVLEHSEKTEGLKNITTPVLLVKGTGSSVFLHQIIDLMATEFPQAQVVEFPGGHAPHLVAKDKFLLAVDSLIVSAIVK